MERKCFGGMNILGRYVHIIFLFFSYATSQEHPLHESNSWEASQETNESYHHLIKTLRDNGYVIKEFPGRSPVALFGDTAYDPHQLFSQLSEGRISSFLAKKHWIDSNGSPHARYFFDSESTPNKKVFTDATQSWIKSTCIRFEKLPDGPCKQDLPYPSICVGSFDGCWSMIGAIHPKGGEPQKLSIAKDCLTQSSAHEFGHALGSNHHHSRPDRDEFITLNNEHYALMPNQDEIAHLKRRWQQGGICAKDQVVDLPVPYDYLSLMHYSTTAFGNDDYRGILLTKNVRHQYMLNYHYYAEQLQSHYDLYTVNVIYGCDKIWNDACVKNGKTPPKCQNLGYLGKKCECLCPDAFEGPACEKKKGPIFPLMPKAKVVVEVQENKMVDLTDEEMSPEHLDGRVGRFEAFQFMTVIVDGKDPDTQVSITIIQTDHHHSDQIGDHLSQQDCTHVFFWGLSSLGRMRTECFSTMANNEPAGPWFHSRTNRLDMSAYSSFGYFFSAPEMTIDLMRLKMSVVFAPRPGKFLKTKPSKFGNYTGLEHGGDGDTSADDGDTSAEPAAMTAVAAGGGIAIVLLLAAVALALFYFYYSSKVKIRAEVDEAAGSESASQEADEDSSSGEESKSNASNDGAEEEKAEDADADDKKEPDEKEKTSEEEASKQPEQGILAKLPSLW